MASPEDLPPLPTVNLNGTRTLGQKTNGMGSLTQVTTYIAGIHERLGVPQYDGWSKAPETVIIQRTVKPVIVINIPSEEQPWYK